MYAMLGGLACGLAIVVWWLFFSRAAWPERVAAIALMIVALLLTSRVTHISLAGGMMGMLVFLYGLPVVGAAFVAAVVVSRRWSVGYRRAAMASAILLACAAFTLLRTEGIAGDGASAFRWRWTPTAEERLLAQARNEKDPVVAATVAPAETQSPIQAGNPLASPTLAPMLASPATTVATKSQADWSGFRGAARDSVVRGLRINTNWTQTPPAEVWRKPIGPGWSSFAVNGERIYTQEQRGEDEIVSAYNLNTGEPVWRHRDAARFYESNGGAGPRGTPTIHNGRVYSLGATGIVNALNASNGSVVWTRNAATDTGAKPPGWGFAGSPLVVNDLVIVAASGNLIAYDSATGKPRWQGPTRGGGYSSPHLVTINGVAQVLLLSGGGAVSLAPTDGAQLWEHSWESGASIVQPVQLAGGDLLISACDAMGGVGMRRLTVAPDVAKWTVTERWTSRGLKPYYNDYVIHKGHAYGFDGSILGCVDLADGQRKWKGGRYGHGQLIALPEQDLLLVLSEEGDLALVSAASDQFTELAKFKAIEGKTWNHPVLVNDTLLVRNGEEMAAFRLR